MSGLDAEVYLLSCGASKGEDSIITMRSDARGCEYRFERIDGTVWRVEVMRDGAMMFARDVTNDEAIGMIE